MWEDMDQDNNEENVLEFFKLLLGVDRRNKRRECNVKGEDEDAGVDSMHMMQHDALRYIDKENRMPSATQQSKR